MKLQDIFEQLTFGELKQVSIGGYSEGRIQPENYPEIINHINIALMALYVRFPLEEKEVILETREDIFTYQLDSTYAYTQVADPEVDLWYLNDINNPFLDDVASITSVFNGEGDEIRLNDTNDILSVFSPSYRSIQVPYATGHEQFSIIFRAEPTKVTYTTDEEGVHSTDLTVDVAIPLTLLEPLLTYIEHRVHKARGGEAGIQQASIAKAHYEKMCQDIEDKNSLNIGLNNTNVKPELNGWI